MWVPLGDTSTYANCTLFPKATRRLSLDSAANFQCDENTCIGMVTGSNAGHTR